MIYAIVGNGVAGTKAAEAIRKQDPQGDICILTEEPFPFYSRIRLIDFLAGEAREEDLVIRNPEWYRQRNIEVFLETPVRNVDAVHREIVNAAGGGLGYDRLLLATGGVSFIPPISGAEKRGVFALRNLEDAQKIRSWVQNDKRRVVVIGGGVLGLEAGNALRKVGCAVTVVEFFPRLLPRQMDPAGAALLRDQFEKLGFTFFLGAKTGEIQAGTDGVTGVFLEDGNRIECDTILVSAGVRPNAGLAKELGLAMDKGVIVNDRMETSLHGIYAAGDLAEHRGVVYGIWPAAEKQGEVAGTNMAGGNALYEGTTISNMLKVAGVDLFAIGDIDADGSRESAVFVDRDRHVYKKIVLENRRITGAILYGDTAERGKVTACLQEQKVLDDATVASLKRGDFTGL